MIIKLADPRGLLVKAAIAKNPQVFQKLPKATLSEVVEESDTNVTHVPRPADEQSGRKKNPVRIIQ